jgi:DNA-binding response OmpR family regulator
MDAEKAPPPRGNMKKVLIVDDEYTIRELVSLSLEPSYEVIKAETSVKGLKVAMQAKPDLIILDIMMPVIDGFEFCRRMKGNKETSDIPIIILSAKHQADDLRKAIILGVDEYITKPFEPEILKDRVDAYLRQPRKKMKKKLIQYGKSFHYIKGD